MKTTGDKGEQIVIDYFKKKGIKVHKAEYKAGYDIKAGNMLVEVKSTNTPTKQKPFFLLSENEFLTACKNKNYWIYWVSVKQKEIILKINRNDILMNIKPHNQYRLPLSQLKKKIIN